MSVFVFVWVRERETEREDVCALVCVCVNYRVKRIVCNSMGACSYVLEREKWKVGLRMIETCHSLT